MNINDISTQILFTTVPLWVKTKDNERVFGTGLLFNYLIDKDKNISIPLLISNYHVVKNAKEVITEFVKSENGLPSKSKIKVGLDIKSMHFDEEKDLVTFPIGYILNHLINSNNQVFYRAIEQSLFPSKEQINKFSAIEKILFIGYPSGLYDSINSIPIVREGITATPIWNNFADKDNFLIDAGVYPGSSGSPVILFNQGSYADGDGIVIGTRLLFLGILNESLITKKTEKQQPYFLGLGNVINSFAVQRFISDAIKKFNINKTT